MYTNIHTALIAGTEYCSGIPLKRHYSRQSYHRVIFFSDNKFLFLEFMDPLLALSIGRGEDSDGNEGISVFSLT